MRRLQHLTPTQRERFFAHPDLVGITDDADDRRPHRAVRWRRTLEAILDVIEFGDDDGSAGALVPRRPAPRPSGGAAQLALPGPAVLLADPPTTDDRYFAPSRRGSRVLTNRSSFAMARTPS